MWGTDVTRDTRFPLGQECSEEMALWDHLTTSSVGGWGVLRHQPRQAGWRQGREMSGPKEGGPGQRSDGVLPGSLSIIDAMTYHMKWDSPAETGHIREREKQKRDAAVGSKLKMEGVRI